MRNIEIERHIFRVSYEQKHCTVTSNNGVQDLERRTRAQLVYLFRASPRDISPNDLARKAAALAVMAGVCWLLAPRSPERLVPPF